MQYIVDYDISALFILITIAIHSSFYLQLPSLKNRLFDMLIYCSLINVLTDSLSVYTIANAKSVPLWINQIINTTYYFTQVAVIAIMFLFVLSFIDVLRLTIPRKGVYALIPLMLVELITLSNPWTKLFFYFTPDHVYTYGPLRLLPYVVTSFYLFSIVVLLIKFRMSLTKEAIISTVFFVAAVVFAMIFQIFFSKYLVIGLATALAILLMYITMQNPAETRDNITGLFNRTSFIDSIGLFHKKSGTNPVVLIYFNDLTVVDSVLGPRRTDKAAIQLAEFLSGKVNRSRLYRLDRYTIGILPETIEELDQLFRDLDERFRFPWFIDGNEIQLSPAICYVLTVPNESQLEDLIELLLKRTRSVDTSEGAMIVKLDEETIVAMRRELTVEKALREALASDGLSLYFQPIYDLHTGRFHCAEVLARFIHPDLGYIPPDEFILVAERSGLIDRVGNQIVEKACAFLSENDFENQPSFTHLTVNLSVAELIQKSLPEKVMRIIHDYQINTEMIQFEITETAATISYNTLSASIEELMKTGLKFLLDDFGSGYANFTSVIELPFVTVKIDRSMLVESYKDEKKKIVFEQTISMLKNLGLNVVVEGVEEEWQFQTLKDLNVDMGQGYFFARPMPGDEFLEFMKKEANIYQTTPSKTSLTL